MKKAIVLLSGGQDSSTCLFWAKANFEEVIAFGLDYGQKHRQELAQAAIIAGLAGVEYRVVDIAGALSGSSLTDHSLDHNEQVNSLPRSFTPGRNALFLAIAAGFGHNHGAHDLVTGACQTDFSGYPDCRRTFMDAMQVSLSLALGTDIRIHTPLMYLTKAETWKLAAELGCVEAIRAHTLTDYNGDMTPNEWGMGREDNPASILRKKGYEEAKAQGWV
jgi:7-cyano-7-deazaguanine synthase